MPSRLIKSTKHNDFVYSGWHPARRDLDFRPPSRSNMGDLRSPESTNQSNHSNDNQCSSVNSANVTVLGANLLSHSPSPEKEKNPGNNSFREDDQSTFIHTDDLQWDHSFDKTFSQEILDENQVSINGLRTDLNKSLEILYMVRMLAQNVNSVTTKANATLMANMRKLKTLRANYNQINGTITLLVNNSKDIQSALGDKYDLLQKQLTSLKESF